MSFVWHKLSKYVKERFSTVFSLIVSSPLDSYWKIVSCKSLFRNPKQEYSVVGRSSLGANLNIDYFDLSNKTLHVSYTGLYQVWHILCLGQSGLFVHIWTKISKNLGAVCRPFLCPFSPVPLPSCPSPLPLPLGPLRRLNAFIIYNSPRNSTWCGFGKAWLGYKARLL